ncbi:MAG: hypothetical protein P9L99_14400 [Candidatus Lernaella stagnicola]|nr:hypothetical protein [Candidatus Lernaella stagnicola]
MATTQIDRANALRWDGRTRGYYEVYYLKWNDAASRTAGWVRYTLTSPLPAIGKPYCELWGIFFDVDKPANHFGVRNRFAIDALRHADDPFAVNIGDAELTADRTRGAIHPSASGSLMSWDLHIRALDPVARPFPHDWMYKGKFPTTKIIVPHQNSRFSGVFQVGDRTIELHDAPGQQSHLFGTRHGHRWAWGHCNSFAEDENAVWEGLDGQVKLGPALPHFKYFYVKAFGQEYWFNSLSQLVLNESRWDTSRWRFGAENAGVKMTGEITTRPGNFVTVGYMDPDGGLLYCHNSKISTMRLELTGRDGKSIGTLTSENGCAVEFVDRRIYPEMTVYI